MSSFQSPVGVVAPYADVLLACRTFLPNIGEKRLHDEPKERLRRRLWELQWPCGSCFGLLIRRTVFKPWIIISLFSPDPQHNIVAVTPYRFTLVTNTPNTTHRLFLVIRKETPTKC